MGDFGGPAVYTGLMSRFLRLFRKVSYGLGESTAPIEPIAMRINLESQPEYAPEVEAITVADLDNQTTATLSFENFVKKFEKKAAEDHVEQRT